MEARASSSVRSSYKVGDRILGCRLGNHGPGIKVFKYLQGEEARLLTSTNKTHAGTAWHVKTAGNRRWRFGVAPRRRLDGEQLCHGYLI
jgi:hypothetical protein